ncbi:hypothetical protein B9Z55_027139 [Caenorhabditis nigoni]|uniref:GOLD domain-containing protein n=1 Tax=Caenorhabditis nigoni TaxID=1611254 RepID=A0A2G5SIX0_9PELO|nr:hypothetical protein B9Z55_027139 [Caenorhabditis nigoni]
MVTGNYKVQLYDPNTKGYGDYPNIGMHVEVKDPRISQNSHFPGDSLQTLHRRRRFTFTSNTPGEHIICIYSTAPRGSMEHSCASIWIFRLETMHRTMHRLLKKTSLNELQLRIRQLLDQVDQITKEQNYQRYREERFRQTSESTNSRVFYWSIAQVVVLALTGAWQMRHLRGFFEAKKLV